MRDISPLQNQAAGRPLVVRGGSVSVSRVERTVFGVSPRPLRPGLRRSCEEAAALTSRARRAPRSAGCGGPSSCRPESSALGGDGDGAGPAQGILAGFRPSSPGAVVVQLGSRVRILFPPLAHRVTLGRLFIPLYPSFFVCKKRVPTS